jgi:hypothetical protein
MRTGNLLFSAAHFFVALFIISLGIFFLALPYADEFRFFATHFIHNKPELLKLIGGLILGTGVILFSALYVLNRHRYLRIKMGPAETLIDEAIIHNYVSEYWREMQPYEDAQIDVMVQKGEVLEIIVTTPKNWEGKVEEHLMRLQDDLGDRLARRLGYYREFYLTLSD